MSLSLAAAAVGAYAHLFVGGIFSGGLVSMIGSIGFAIALFSTPDENGKNRDRRVAYLMGLAGCMGLSLGPLMEVALLIDSAIVPTALASTALIFACFTVSVIFSDQRSVLYLGGSLLSGLSCLMLISLVNLFLRSSLLTSVYLYGGLVLACGFVCYDTALIVEKRRRGDQDYVAHALLLFVDFVDLFRHLVVLLSRREADRQAGDRRKRRAD